MALREGGGRLADATQVGGRVPLQSGIDLDERVEEFVGGPKNVVMENYLGPTHEQTKGTHELL